MNRKAFTLIELLVVVAIIAILAAILFPVFAAAKAAAKSAACLSNMRQISIAARLYISDYDDMWFPSLSPSAVPGFAPQRSWIGFDNNNTAPVGGIYGNVDLPASHPIQSGLIDVYLKSEGIKRCPALPNGWQTGYAINGFTTSMSSAYYADNALASGNEYSPTTETQVMVDGVLVSTASSDGDVQEPADTLIMWEHQAVAPYCNFLQQYDWLAQPPDLAAPREHFHFLHGQGSNTMWADGHSKSLQYGQLRRPMFSSKKDFYPSG